MNPLAEGDGPPYLSAQPPEPVAQGQGQAAEVGHPGSRPPPCPVSADPKLLTLPALQWLPPHSLSQPSGPQSAHPRSGPHGHRGLPRGNGAGKQVLRSLIQGAEPSPPPPRVPQSRSGHELWEHSTAQLVPDGRHSESPRGPGTRQPPHVPSHTCWFPKQPVPAGPALLRRSSPRACGCSWLLPAPLLLGVPAHPFFLHLLRHHVLQPRRPPPLQTTLVLADAPLPPPPRPPPIALTRRTLHHLPGGRWAGPRGQYS